MHISTPVWNLKQMVDIVEEGTPFTTHLPSKKQNLSPVGDSRYQLLGIEKCLALSVKRS